MRFPAGFDPEAVTKICLNACYFANDQDPESVARELFPNAEVSCVYLQEMPECGLAHIEPDVPEEIAQEVYVAIDDALPQGTWRGWDFGYLRGDDSGTDEEQERRPKWVGIPGRPEIEAPKWSTRPDAWVEWDRRAAEFLARCDAADERWKAEKGNDDGWVPGDPDAWKAEG